MFFGVDCFLEIISHIRVSCLWKQSSDNCSKIKKTTQFLIFDDEVLSTPLLPELKLLLRCFVCIVLVVSFCYSFNRKFLLNLELVTLNWVIKSWYLKGSFAIIFIHNFSDALGNSWFIQISVFYTLTDIGLNPLLILLHSKHVSLSIKAMQIQQ